MAPSQNGPGQEGIKFNQCAGIIFHETGKAEGDRGSIERMSAAGAASTIPTWPCCVLQISPLNLHDYQLLHEQSYRSELQDSPGAEKCVAACRPSFESHMHAFIRALALKRPWLLHQAGGGWSVLCVAISRFWNDTVLPKINIYVLRSRGLFCFDNRLFILTFK